MLKFCFWNSNSSIYSLGIKNNIAEVKKNEYFGDYSLQTYINFCQLSKYKIKMDELYENIDKSSFVVILRSLLLLIIH